MAVKELGIVGLGTMGRSLALNFLDHDTRVVAWNLEVDAARAFAAANDHPNLSVVPQLAGLVERLSTPRVILLLVKAGDAVEEVLDALVPRLSEGDVVIDGGNTHYERTRSRLERVGRNRIDYVGLGISGGEHGARFGPSLMAGCNAAVWERIESLLVPVAAKSSWGRCADRVGDGGAGHFVKMVHNGIEYADMQLLAEAYDVLKRGLGMDAAQQALVFERWQAGPLRSFLVELTARLLTKRDVDGGVLVEKVVDEAEQKGTGRWAVEAALELGVAAPSITAAVDARSISAGRTQRLAMASRGVAPEIAGIDDVDSGRTLEDLEHALVAARICALIQGLQLIEGANHRVGWDIDAAAVMKLWTGGSIVRSALLDTLIPIVADSVGIVDVVTAPDVAALLRDDAWRRLVQRVTGTGIPVPALSAGLAWFQSIRTPRLPQNLIQAQRDAFGAHTYRRLDDPDGNPEHSDWTS